VPDRSPTDPASPVAVFQALADPTRVAVVERLSIGPASASELGRPFSMALPSLMQHLAVLERAGIVTSHKTGRTRVFQLAPDGLRVATEWLARHRRHWERRLDQLDQLLLATTDTEPTTDTDHPQEQP
jgi:DNA-binding transcriptional ArsR family regulator